MANEILYQCSNCGKTEQTRAVLGVPDGMFYAGLPWNLAAMNEALKGIN